MPVIQPLLLTVNGTGVADPFGPGFSSDIGRAITNPWINIASQFWGPAVGRKYGSFIYWQPIGYPAAVFPMQPSWMAAVAELSNQVSLHENPNNPGYCPPGTPIVASGYSQGAIAVAVFLRDYVLNPNGKHHNRLLDIVVRGGVIQYGDPMRSPGIAHGNEVAGFAPPKLLDGVITGGIAGPGCLTPAQTDIAGQPPFYLSCALDGDLYAASPQGPSPWTKQPSAGFVETSFYNAVQTGSFLDFAKIALDLGKPVGDIEAAYNGIKFISQGTDAPHWQYGPFVPAMTQWMIDRVSVAA